MALDVLIVGCGSIGSVITGLLVDKGYHVGVLEASEKIPNLRIRKKGSEKIIDTRSYENVPFYSPENIEKIILKKNAPIIVATKTYSTYNVAQDLTRLNTINSLDRNPIVLFQNGINPEQKMKVYLQMNGAAHLANNVFGAVLMMMADLENGVIDYDINKIELGCWDDTFRINKILSTAVYHLPFDFVSVSGTDGYKKSRLEKAALNSANSLCALFNVTVGGLIENETTRIMVEQKIKECARISEANGYKLDDIMNKWASASKMVYEHYPSMWHDFNGAIKGKRKLETEIDDLDGTFVGIRSFGEAWPKLNDFGWTIVGDFTNLFNTLLESDKLTGENMAVETAKEFIDINRLFVGLPRFGANLSNSIMESIARKFKYWELEEKRFGGWGNEFPAHKANDARFYMRGNLYRMMIEKKIY